MSAELLSISPFASYLSSFADGAEHAWLWMALASVLHWFFIFLPPVIALGYVDRKLAADMQVRIGPNRVGAAGTLQPLADFIRAIFKEDIESASVGAWLHKFGVVFSIVCVFVAIGDIPFAESWALSSFEGGIVTVLGVLTLSQIFVFWGAFSVKSGWSYLAGMRMLPLVAAYVFPLFISVAVPVSLSSGTRLEQFVKIQGGMPWHWMLFHNPGALFAGMVFFVSLLLWAGTPPFDVANAEQELSGAGRREYSGLRSGLVGFLADASLFLAAALFVTVFCGGWHTPFNLESFGRAARLVEWLFFMAKTVVLVLLAIWARWSLPRMRTDQVIRFSWSVLAPASVAALFINLAWLSLFNGKGFGEFL